MCAEAYHSKKSNNERDRILTGFRLGTIPVVVSTSAFGLGIDKANVRAVIHHKFSLSIDDYAQQAGRKSLFHSHYKKISGAGRDGQRSYCRVYFAMRDLEALKFISGANKKDMCERDCLNYCVGNECRHVMLARAFGEKIKPCGSNCDFCKPGGGISVSRNSSGQNLLKKIEKAVRNHEQSFETDEEDRRAGSPKKKVLKFDMMKKTMKYVDEDNVVNKAPPIYSASEGDRVSVSFWKRFIPLFRLDWTRETF
jgi:superfamily II DNA helicase RecQ